MSAQQSDNAHRLDRAANEPASEFALIVGAARSGTTLTRLLLDAHPEIGAPSEAGLPSLMAHMVRAWATVNADAIGSSERRDPGGTGAPEAAPARWEAKADGERVELRESAAKSGPRLPPGAEEWVRPAIQQAMRTYCVRGRKRIYCDKSLDSVHYLPIVRELFPTVRCLLVFRHVMDTVASGIEASPWGFQAYGYESYVDASPRNTVAALASYWLDHVAKALQWETQYPEACHRVRYEDLVLEPEKTIAAIQSFLGVTIDLSVLSSAFDREPPRGPGDYKIEHTTGVHVKSIGHGKRVPVGMLPPPLLTALNIQLAELGYDELTEAWNTEERIYDGGGQGIWAKRLAELMGEVRISEESKSAPSFAVVAEDHMPMRWVIDPQAMTIRQGDGDVEGVLTGTAQDLVLMLTKEENLGVLLRAGRVRHMVAREEQQRRDLKRELDSIVAVLLNRRKSVNDR